MLSKPKSTKLRLDSFLQFFSGFYKDLHTHGLRVFPGLGSSSCIVLVLPSLAAVLLELG
jgi:hypothetical protein